VGGKCREHKREQASLLTVRIFTQRSSIRSSMSSPEKKSRFRMPRIKEMPRDRIEL
jgi:hypothetical protein